MKYFLPIFVLSLFFLSCWKRQDHEITKPVTPHYTMTGTITDMDSAEKLANCVVKLQALSLSYDEPFITAFDTTDKSGIYRIGNAIPGQYSMTVFRETYEVLSVNAQVEHRDATLNIAVPKVLTTSSLIDFTTIPRYDQRTFPRLHGIHWKGRGSMCATWLWKEYSDDLPRYRVVTGNYDSGFSIIGEKTFENENPEIKAITYPNTFFTSNGNTLYRIHPAFGSVVSTTTLSYTISDLTTNNSSVWATVLAGKVIQLNSTGTEVEKAYDVPYEYPGGIAWDGTYFWTYSKGENLLYKHDTDFSIQKTYRCIYLDLTFSYSQIHHVSYMSFDADKRLWMNNETNGIFIVDCHGE